MDWMYQSMQPHYYGIFAPVFALLPLVMLWSLAWKGWALWLAARRKETVWFVVLLVLNTAGLLEIFYIFVIAKRSDTVKTLVHADTTVSETTVKSVSTEEVKQDVHH